VLIFPYLRYFRIKSRGNITFLCENIIRGFFCSLYKFIKKISAPFYYLSLIIYQFVKIENISVKIIIRMFDYQMTDAPLRLTCRFL
jgi:hypothetical protein